MPRLPIMPISLALASFFVCQSCSQAGLAPTELETLCKEYAIALKAKNWQEMRRVVALINPKIADRSTGDQIKWTGECLAKHNVSF